MYPVLGMHAEEDISGLVAMVTMGQTAAAMGQAGLVTVGSIDQAAG